MYEAEQPISFAPLDYTGNKYEFDDPFGTLTRKLGAETMNNP